MINILYNNSNNRDPTVDKRGMGDGWLKYFKLLLIKYYGRLLLNVLVNVNVQNSTRNTDFTLQASPLYLK